MISQLIFYIDCPQFPVASSKSDLKINKQEIFKKEPFSQPKHYTSIHSPNYIYSLTKLHLFTHQITSIHSPNYIYSLTKLNYAMNKVQFGWFKEICSEANVNVNSSKLLVNPISCHRFLSIFSEVFLCFQRI